MEYPQQKGKPGEGDFEAKPEDYMCFGTIQPEHPECVECPLRQDCAEKAGVEV